MKNNVRKGGLGYAMGKAVWQAFSQLFASFFRFARLAFPRPEGRGLRSAKSDQIRPHQQLAEGLLACGADPRHADENGLTAYGGGRGGASR